MMMNAGAGRYKGEGSAVTLNSAFDEKKKVNTVEAPKRKVVSRPKTKKEQIMEKYETLTSKQKIAFDLIVGGESIFLSGSGGVGKSYTSELAIEYLRDVEKKNVMVCAPTGIAAHNIGGCTIHKQFGFPLEVCLKEKKGKYEPLKRVNKALKSCDVFFCDEVSMLRIDVFESMLASIEGANEHRKKQGLKPIQICLQGDFCQLPSVICEQDRYTLEAHYNNPKNSKSGKLGGGFIFNSHKWDDLNLKTVLLTEVVRQKDEELVYYLNKLRFGEEGFTNYFNHVTCMEEKKESMTLAPYNRIVDTVNRKKLAELEGKEYIFKARLHDKATEFDCGRNYELPLKIGAKVIFTINDNGGEGFELLKDRPQAYVGSPLFMNGTLGRVLEIQGSEIVEEYTDDDYIGIEILETGEYVKLKRKSTDVNIFEEKNGKLVKKKLGYYDSYPISLAYASSIHRSQGLSLNSVNLQLNCFEHGQLYTALSRCKTADGMHLNDFIREDAVIISDEVKEFYANLEEYNPNEE